jgi:large subunit ribosomal protein L21
MKYAVIRTGGKQYKINEGDVIDIERLGDVQDTSVTFSEVLMANADGDVHLGAPLLSDVTVKGSVVEHMRGDKIRVAKFKAKARYRRVTGHRQALTRVKIESIDISGAKKAQKTEKKPIEKSASKKAENATVTTS